jgi:hypothetical protein
VGGLTLKTCSEYTVASEANLKWFYDEMRVFVSLRVVAIETGFTLWLSKTGNISKSHLRWKQLGSVFQTIFLTETVD